MSAVLDSSKEEKKGSIPDLSPGLTEYLYSL
jgi:hypothetical protein